MCSEVIILVNFDPENLHHLLGLDDLILVIRDDIFILINVAVKVHILGFVGINDHAVIPVVPKKHDVELLQVLINFKMGVAADDMLGIIYIIYDAVFYIFMLL